MDPLPDDVLARRLPLKPENITLNGKYIRLEPLNINRDSESLYSISNGSRIEIGEKIIEFDNHIR